MKSLVTALAIVLTVPAMCTAVALASRAELDARWQGSLRRPFLVRGQMPDERVIAKYSLAARCGDPRFAAGVRPCRSYSLFSSMATAAVVTGAAGVAFLAAIAMAGAATRSRGDRLRRIFKPSLYATVGALVLLVLLHGGLGVIAVFLLGEVIQRWPVMMVLVLAGATAAAALSMVQLALTVTRRESPSVVARVLNVETQRRCSDWVREAAASVAARPPEHLLCGLRPFVYADDDPLVCLDGRITGRSIYLSLPLARILSIEEMRGLVAHELAHFTDGPAGESTGVLRLHSSVRRSIHTLSERAFGIRTVTSLPAVSVLSLFMEAFERGAAAANQEREAAADRVAAAAVGAPTLAAALIKTHAFTPAWEPVAVAISRAAMDDSQYVNASALFEHVASAGAGPERLAGAGALSSPHPADVHPALAQRLRALGVSPGEVPLAALATQPACPAVSLIEGYEQLERELSEVEHRIKRSAEC